MAMTQQTRDTVREEVERAASEVLAQFTRQHPELRKTEIPAPLKWAGAIAGALMTALAASFFVWLTSAVNSMQVTVARIDERQESQLVFVTSQIESLQTRVSDLEVYHKQGGR